MSPADAEGSTRGWRVSGRVQGVGFRIFVRRVARELGLGGWVRNCVDGSVEIKAAGDEGALDRLESAITVGPRWSQVEKVDRLESSAAQLPASFEIS